VLLLHQHPLVQESFAICGPYLRISLRGLEVSQELQIGDLHESVVTSRLTDLLLEYAGSAELVEGAESLHPTVLMSVRGRLVC